MEVLNHFLIMDLVGVMEDEMEFLVVVIAVKTNIQVNIKVALANVWIFKSSFV